MAIVRSSRFKQMLIPRKGYFDHGPLHLLNRVRLKQGILLFYFLNDPFFLGAVLLDKCDSNTLLWRTTNPLWYSPKKIYPIRIKKAKKGIIFYFKSNHKQSSIQSVILLLNIPLSMALPLPSLAMPLQRIAHNPILRPNAHRAWEASAVLNSGALYLNQTVHFVYRAITALGESVLGYAASHDGIHIHERLDKPIYACNYLLPKTSNVIASQYISGPSWHGCEDPRLTLLDDTIYMTYTAFNGMQAPFVALTSIKVSDFLKKQWAWKNPMQISMLGEQHKNWVIFPEKIRGQYYAILHSLTPNILIEYLETLDEVSLSINSHHSPQEQEIGWDNWIRGVGPPPIKTKEGWLVLYHAMDRRDPDKYKVGAMILDLHYPTKVLYRSSYPVLEPHARYETQGHKANVVYACGAVVIHETLFVYYGAADTALCVAFANLEQFLTGIKHSQMPMLTPI